MSIEALEGITDQELFNEASSDDAPVVETVAEPEVVEQQEQPRDEHGKFAAKAADEPAPVVEQPVEQADDDKAQIPSWRLREVAEERRAAMAERDAIKAERDRIAQDFQNMQRRLQAMEKPAVEAPAKPDPLLDPDGYEKYLEQRFEQKQINQSREFDLRLTRQSQPEIFDKAYAEAQTVIRSGSQEAAELNHKINSTNTPGEVLLNWYRARETQREVGNDPNAYFDKRFEAYLADPANQAKVLERIRGGVQPQPLGSPRVSPTNLPPSLTRATNAASVLSADANDVSDDGLWRHSNA